MHSKITTDFEFDAVINECKLETRTVAAATFRRFRQTLIEDNVKLDHTIKGTGPWSEKS